MDATLTSASAAVATNTEKSSPIACPAPSQPSVDLLNSNTNSIKDESKSKKKRRKKSQMKKKNAQRKSSSSSSVGSATPLDAAQSMTDDMNNKQAEDADTSSLSISNNTNNTNSSNDEASPKSGEQPSAPLVTAPLAGDDSPISEKCQTSPITPSNTRIPDLDIHFFSDTEVTSSGGNGPGGIGRGAGRPSTPIQSDSELEISMREKETDSDLISASASWKWGELPTPEPKEQSDNPAQAQRNSMLSNMFNFMKKNNKMRKQGTEAGGVYLSDLDTETMDPEMLAMYFPSMSGMSKEQQAQALEDNAADFGNNNTNNEDDRESGNGTSLPHSPSSLEGQKSLDSDYEDGHGGIGAKMPDGK